MHNFLFWMHLKNIKPRKFINTPIFARNRFFSSRQAWFCKRGLIARSRKKRRRGRRRAARTFRWKTTPYLRSRLLFGRPSHKYWKSGDVLETFRLPGGGKQLQSKNLPRISITMFKTRRGCGCIVFKAWGWRSFRITFHNSFDDDSRDGNIIYY